MGISTCHTGRECTVSLDSWDSFVFEPRQAQLCILGSFIVRTCTFCQPESLFRCIVSSQSCFLSLHHHTVFMSLHVSPIHYPNTAPTRHVGAASSQSPLPTKPLPLGRGCASPAWVLQDVVRFRRPQRGLSEQGGTALCISGETQEWQLSVCVQAFAIPSCDVLAGSEQAAPNVCAFAAGLESLYLTGLHVGRLRSQHCTTLVRCDHTPSNLRP